MKTRFWQYFFVCGAVGSLIESIFWTGLIFLVNQKIAYFGLLPFIFFYCLLFHCIFWGFLGVLALWMINKNYNKISVELLILCLIILGASMGIAVVFLETGLVNILKVTKLQSNLIFEFWVMGLALIHWGISLVKPFGLLFPSIPGICVTLLSFRSFKKETSN